MQDDVAFRWLEGGEPTRTTRMLLLQLSSIIIVRFTLTLLVSLVKFDSFSW